ncbi:MAG: ABC transporter substrate-binding protein [Planctomycetota bacterium]|jgi:peptide/nickel transport system substrate-binding protein
MVLAWIKVGLGVLIAVLLVLSVAQRDRLERRMRDIETRIEDLRRDIEGRTFGAAPRGSDATADPRTAAYVAGPDNLLSDPSIEPAPPQDAPRGGTINFFFGSNPRSLNRYTLNEAQLRDHVERFVCEMLARRSFTDPDRFVPELANRVTANADRTVFTVHLRKGRYWHKPHLTPEEQRGQAKWLAALPRQEVTAEDVKFTFDVVRSRYSSTPIKAQVLNVTDVEVVDRYTVRVHWKDARYFNLPATLAQLPIFPKFIYGRNRVGKELPPDEAAQQFFQHWFNQKLCGSGPFRFEGFVQNQLIRLRRDPEYPGIQPAVDEIVVHIVDNEDVRLAKFKAGEIDLTKVEPHQYRSEYLEGGPGTLKEMVDKGEISLRMHEGFAYYYIGFNFRRAIFRDQRVRRALSHAFPKERVIRDVYYGLAIDHNSHCHRSTSGYDKELPRIAFDLEKAAALLDEAGWTTNDRGVREKTIDGGRKELRFSILIPNIRPVYRDFCLIYQKELRKIGVIMELELREWQKMLALLNDRDFDATSLGWSSTWDTDPAQIWESISADIPKGSNHISYKSEELDAAIHALQLEFDTKKRKELWSRFQRTIARDDPYIFLFIPIEPWFVRNRLGNQYFSPIRPSQWLIPWFVQRR